LLTSKKNKNIIILLEEIDFSIEYKAIIKRKGRVATELLLNPYKPGKVTTKVWKKYNKTIKERGGKKEVLS